MEGGRNGERGKAEEVIGEGGRDKGGKKEEAKRQSGQVETEDITPSLKILEICIYSDNYFSKRLLPNTTKKPNINPITQEAAYPAPNHRTPNLHSKTRAKI